MAADDGRGDTKLVLAQVGSILAHHTTCDRLLLFLLRLLLLMLPVWRLQYVSARDPLSQGGGGHEVKRRCGVNRSEFLLQHRVHLNTATDLLTHPFMSHVTHDKKG